VSSYSNNFDFLMDLPQIGAARGIPIVRFSCANSKCGTSSKLYGADPFSSKKIVGHVQLYPYNRITYLFSTRQHVELPPTLSKGTMGGEGSHGMQEPHCRCGRSAEELPEDMVLLVDVSRY
jgi:hypothetical protein